MDKKGLLLAAVLAASLAGCASAPVDRRDSKLFAVPADTVIDWREDVALDDARTRLLVQDGRIVDKPRRYQPYCYLDIRADRATTAPARVEPERFRVVRTRKQKNWVLAGPTRVAGAYNQSFYLDWRMEFDSVRQPHVTALVCGIFADWESYNYLSVNEIQQQLGSVATVELPPE